MARERAPICPLVCVCVRGGGGGGGETTHTNRYIMMQLQIDISKINMLPLFIVSHYHYTY